MAKSCEHLQYLTAADFPLLEAPAACEECPAEGRAAWRCGNAVCADMLVAATRRVDVRRHDTSATRGILSCARSHRTRDGLGAMSMKFMAVSRTKVPAL
jgi:hypothetical protein